MEEIKTKEIPSKIFWLAGIAFLIKILLIPFVQNTDADAVLRVLNAVNWKENPSWISTGDWGPFHFYLLGTFMMIWNDAIHMPFLMTAFFSTLTLFPFYFFIRREFNEKGAFISTIFLFLCPILFRNSLVPLSETPFLFFVVLTMNFISKGTRENRNHWFLLAGTCITIASGIRFEAWLLSFILGLIILLNGNWKGVILFGIIAMLFPLTWLIQSYLNTGSIFTSFHWAALAVNENVPKSFESHFRRIWYFPFSWMIALGPVAAFITLKEIINSFKKENRNKQKIIWTIPFLTIFAVYFFNAQRGSLLLQHRFTGTLVILSLPFFAAYFENYSARKIKVAWIGGILIIGLSFVWNTSGVKPLPRLKDQTGEKISQLVNREINDTSGLIIDFWTWENSYYIAYQSRLHLSNIALIYGSKNQGIQKERLAQITSEHGTGVILVKKNSELFNEIILEDHQMKFKWINKPMNAEYLFQNDELILLKYSSPQTTSSPGLPLESVLAYK